MLVSFVNVTVGNRTGIISTYLLFDFFGVTTTTIWGFGVLAIHWVT